MRRKEIDGRRGDESNDCTWSQISAFTSRRRGFGWVICKVIAVTGTVRIPRREGFGWLIDCPGRAPADKVDMKLMTKRKVTLWSHRVPCTDQEALPSDCPMLMYLSGV
jgi:hypothetical protein